VVPDVLFFFERAQTHLRKMRRQGVRRVAVDDVRRATVRVEKLRWRLRNHPQGNATPVFIVGLQRSGTKMLIFALNQSPEVRIYNESKRSPAFRNFELREDEVIRSLVEKTPQQCVVFKALCDSHRIAELLDDLGTARPGRAIWIYRSPEARARSAVAQFHDNNLRVLETLASGGGAGTWQSAGLTPRLREVIGEFDYSRMNAESAAALWWYVRNSLFFELGLNERDDILLTSYDRFLAEPELLMRSLCSFTGLTYEPRMIAGIAPRPAPSSSVLDIDPSIRALCSELEQRLDSWFALHGTRVAAAPAA
jgi:hypothetical protein